MAPPPPDRIVTMTEHGMSKTRLWLAHALIGLVVVMELVAMITYQEMLPFSPFPMFSYPQREYRASVINAYAVDANTGAEFSLMTTQAMKYSFPIDGRVLQWNFERLATNDDPKPGFEGALGNLFERYERGRTLGRHDGPPIKGVRLYRETWTLYFDVRNADQPDTRTLLAEFVQL